jgi:hypothetical protein
MEFVCFVWISDLSLLNTQCFNTPELYIVITWNLCVLYGSRICPYWTLKDLFYNRGWVFTARYGRLSPYIACLYTVKLWQQAVLDFKLSPCSVCCIFFLLGNSPASEFYMPMFRNTICSIFVDKKLNNDKKKFWECLGYPYERGFGLK